MDINLLELEYTSNGQNNLTPIFDAVKLESAAGTNLVSQAVTVLSSEEESFETKVKLKLLLMALCTGNDGFAFLEQNDDNDPQEAHEEDAPAPYCRERLFSHLILRSLSPELPSYEKVNDVDLRTSLFELQHTLMRQVTMLSRAARVAPETKPICLQMIADRIN